MNLNLVGDMISHPILATTSLHIHVPSHIWLICLRLWPFTTNHQPPLAATSTGIYDMASPSTEIFVAPAKQSAT